MFTIELSMEQIQIIGQALVELPYKVSAPLIDSINRQLAEQQQAAALAAHEQAAREQQGGEGEGQE